MSDDADVASLFGETSPFAPSRDALIQGVLRTIDFERILSIVRRAAEIDPKIVSDLTDFLKTDEIREWDRVRENPPANWRALLPEGAISSVDKPDDVYHLRPIQALALKDSLEQGGLFAPIGVGHGKFLISVLLVVLSVAARRRAGKPDGRWLLLVPANLLPQTHQEVAKMRRHFKMPGVWPNENEYGCIRVESYEKLSSAKASRFMTETITNGGYEPTDVIADECFPYETQVVTDRGTIPIGRIVEERLPVKVRTRTPAGDGWRSVTNWFDNERRTRIVKITHERGSLTCTENHRVWTTENGYVNAIDLTSRHSLSLAEDLLPVSDVAGRGCPSSSDLLRPRLRDYRLPKKPSGRSLRAMRPLVSSDEERSEILHDDMSRCVPEKTETVGGVSTLFEGVYPGLGGEASVFLQLRLRYTESMPAGACEDLRALRLDLSAVAERPKAVLQSLLLGRLANEAAGGTCQGLLAGNRRQVKQGLEEASCESSRAMRSECQTYAREQSLSGSGEARIGRRETERANVSWSGRERETDQATAGPSGRGSTSYRGSDRNRARTRPVSQSPYVLQCRSSRRGDTHGNRNRWEISQDEEVEVPRCAKNSDSRRSRVVRVEVLECGSGSGSEPSSERDPRVYCLEVEETHCFYADGVLVSNCHKIKRPGAARTRKFCRRYRDRPATKLYGMSGSITRDTLRDYWHLLHLAFPAHAPLPRSFPETEAWCQALDEATDNDLRRAPGALLELCDPAEIDRLKPGWSSGDLEERLGYYGETAETQERLLEIVRRGYWRRLVETPGVVATGEGALGTSLVISERIPPAPPARVVEAFDQLRFTGQTPNGDVPDSPISMWRHACELASGFWYRWDPPAPPEWLFARQEWNRFVRNVLAHNRQRLDSPLQVVQAVDAGKLSPTFGPGRELLEAWRLERPNFEPNPVANWVDPWLVHDVLRWFEEQVDDDGKPLPGIVWVSLSAVGESIARESGGKIPYFAGGPEASAGILAQRTSCVASIAAHGTGKNLQSFSRNLVVHPPSGGDVWEQLLGRTHRPGQKADEVRVDFYAHALELRSAFKSARRASSYILHTTGAEQKLTYASISTRPDEEIEELAIAGDPLWLKPKH